MDILTAVVCIIFGIGLPTSACYIVLAVLVAPAMVELGVSVISALLKLFWKKQRKRKLMKKKGRSVSQRIGQLRQRGSHCLSWHPIGC